jgi:hypothetical protein
MSMLVDAIEAEYDNPEASEALIAAIVHRYTISRSHLAMLLDALRGLIEILQSEEHRVDHV